MTALPGSTADLLRRDAIDLWRRTEFQKVKAVQEERMWNLATPAERTMRRSTYLILAMDLDGGSGAIDNRRALMSAPDALWDAVDGEQRMPLSTAVRLWKEAKFALRKEGLTAPNGEHDRAREVVGEMIARWARTGYASRGKGGRVVRRRTRAEKMAEDSAKPIRRGRPPNGARGALREAIAAIASAELSDVGEVERAELWRWLDAEIATTLRMFSMRVKRASDAEKVGPPSRRDVLNACRTLGIDPPKPGEPPDMVGARRRKRALVRAYHPDAQRGDDRLRGLYEDVIAAYDALEASAKWTARQPAARADGGPAGVSATEGDGT